MLAQRNILGLETPFDHLTALMCGQFEVPFGLVSFVHGDLAVFRSEVGLGESALHRDVSVSNILVGMGSGAHLVIEDAALHPVLKDHPMVAGEPFLRFFAGATVSNGKGEPVGAVGIMDSRPRPAPTASELATLDHIAAIAGSMLDQTTAQRVQAERLALLKLAEQMSGVGHWRFDVLSGDVTWSDEVYRIHGLEPGEIEPDYELVLAAYHPDDAEVLADAVSQAIATGAGYAFRLRIQPPGREERLVETKATTEQDETGRTVALFGVFQDVTDAVRSQERLAESESLFRLLNETATDIIARFDPAGRFLYVSPAVRTVLGRDPEDMLGKDCSDFIPPDDLKMIRSILRAYVEAGPEAPTPRYEYRAIRADGSLAWLEAAPRAVRDASGTVVEFHDHVRDITERKAAEREQAEMVETLKLAEAIAGVGHWRWDIATDKVTWSDEVFRMRGRDQATYIPKIEDELLDYHLDDQVLIRAKVSAALATGEGFDIQMRLVGPEGERITQSKALCESDDQGKVVALFGVMQDVTDRVQGHEQMAASEARYRLLADNATDIIATYGMDGVFRYVSPAIEGVLGYRPEELVGRPFWQFMYPADVGSLQAAFAAYAKAGPGAPSPRVAYRGVRKDGQSVWLEAHPKVIRDAAGRALEFQDVVRDVSETKALEDQLIAARDVAEAGARSKSEFLANMSHELRTPLTSVIGFSGLLQGSRNLPENERKYADRIATASEALLSVINDILDYSKLEAEAVDLDPQAFDPRAMVEGAVAIVETQCQGKGLTLETVIDADLPGALMGDEGRLRQVTLNFLSNAVKFTAAGTVRLEMTAVADGRLRVAVTDSGIGIDPDKIDALFDRFTQADASTTRVYGGTGLGLAISHRLIEMMGGEIGADSRPGEGSTFWFEVPMAEALATEEVAGPGDLAIPDGMKILIADDAAPNRELVSAILGGLGLALETVCNGAEAVEAARTGGYDMILMDVHMPVMDGLDATRAIRAMGGVVGGTPIIALTANVQPEQVQRCREAGMDGHVGKPIQVSELLAALATASTPADTAGADVGLLSRTGR